MKFHDRRDILRVGCSSRGIAATVPSCPQGRQSGSQDRAPQSSCQTRSLARAPLALGWTAARFPRVTGSLVAGRAMLVRPAKQMSADGCARRAGSEACSHMSLSAGAAVLLAVQSGIGVVNADLPRPCGSWLFRRLRLDDFRVGRGRRYRVERPPAAPGPGRNSMSPGVNGSPHRSQRRSATMFPPQPAWIVSLGGPPGSG
jgi:hypothetical protein